MLKVVEKVIACDEKSQLSESYCTRSCSKLVVRRFLLQCKLCVVHTRRVKRLSSDIIFVRQVHIPFLFCAAAFDTNSVKEAAAAWRGRKTFRSMIVCCCIWAVEFHYSSPFLCPMFCWKDYTRVYRTWLDIAKLMTFEDLTTFFCVNCQAFRYFFWNCCNYYEIRKRFNSRIQYMWCFWSFLKILHNFVMNAQFFFLCGLVANWNLWQRCHANADVWGVTYHNSHDEEYPNCF